ncbi:MAG: hypothetical protein H6736_21855 [Alphaproteobacteria bacterium]|nr:hypothetical protein [Alphaproteobacteria bacterium]MCB9694463.1 hypothetical protein [Alphaproteobacteria bacterium]
MKTGDIVTDSRAAAWTLGNLLGEGAWGRVWSVRDDGNRTRVLKVPYEPEDLPPASVDRVPLMRKCAVEAAELHTSGPAWLPPLEDRITLPSGAVALLFPQAPTTLARQLQSGLPLVEALDEVLAVVEMLAAAGVEHGNLRPSNILIGSDGRPMLADPVTPTLKTLLPGAERTAPDRKRWSAPDHIANDQWALCSAIYTAAMLEEDVRDASALPQSPATGLDKVALAGLRDKAVARLRRDGANPRFMHRTAERLATLLARGLSGRADPSPPYRFLTARDLLPRLQEVHALVRPGIESVGRLLLSSSASGDVFDAPGPVGFTVSVGPTAGVTEPDDIVCGVRLEDLDATGDRRVPLADTQFAVNKHPSGRFRFEFDIPEVSPGRYRVRVAFSVKDSGDEPSVAEGTFQVRPPPGYVPPPPDEEEVAPLAFTGALKPLVLDDDEDDSDDDAATVLMKRPTIDTDGGEDTDPDADEDAVVQMFPRPLAPTSPGTLVDEQPAPPLPPPVSAPVAAPRPLLAAVPTPAPSETDSEVSEVDPPSHTPVPSVVAPQPSITIAAPPPMGPPGPSIRPTPPPTPVVKPQIAVPPPPPSPLGADHPGWEASHAHEAEFFQPESGVPGGGGEDLVTGRRPSPLDAVREQLGDFARPDSPKFFVAVIAGCFLLILLTLALLRAC